MRRILIAATLILVATLLAIVAWNIHNILYARGEQARKDAMLQALRKGKTREELYRTAGRIGAVPFNQDRVRFEGSYRKVDNGEFPKPLSKDDHPSVSMVFERLGELLIWQYDVIDVTFGPDDRVSGWTLATHYTGV